MKEIEKYLDPYYVEELREWWGDGFPEDHPTLWKEVNEISDRLWEDELFRAALLPLIRLQFEPIAWPAWPDEIEALRAENKRREEEERREPDAKSKKEGRGLTPEESEEFFQLKRDLGL